MSPFPRLLGYSRRYSGRFVVAFAVTPNSLDPRNGNLVFENNTMREVVGWTYLEYSSIHDVTFSDNHFFGKGASSIQWGSGATLSGIV